ncbi:GNAT family N-acetyltransferase [Bacillus sp. DX1.1]|uniref:GNAT family N-acetyltransferase n=1 Tax=unclassified Bacillus (in: firmicutes) TaxID=185979 RepID=UPI00256FECC8|nr:MULTISPECIES: GNAT family N-acetyltransferase [unclassified Bacillus (in: firmicutes)]MDM5156790.1 GNAT family N-acetyltransferase [Bacillus sp. DX1.1]WJE81037.1 GNAT family N-acetyltransferase [Bacillus sp. DX3.1]
MRRLALAEYYTILPVLEGNKRTSTFAYAVCDRMIDGEIFVNERLTAGMIATANGIYYLFGDTHDQEFQYTLFSYIQNDVLTKNKRFTLFVSSIEWETVIENHFSDYFMKIPRKTFLFQRDRFEDRKRELDDSTYKIMRINKNIIEKSTEFTEQYYKEYWGSKEAFLNGGVGFCVLQDQKVVAECVSIFKSNRLAEIDIATHPDYQGRGFAQLVAAYFIEHCIQNDITPCWDCNVDNIPSQKLASKLGFDNPVEYVLYVHKKVEE